MSVITILSIALAVFVALFLFVFFAVKVREQIEHIEKVIKKEGRKKCRDYELSHTPVHSKPFPPAQVAQQAVEEAKKVESIAEKKKAEAAQQALTFTVEPEVNKPRDPNKPKRKSPRPHNRVNNKDEFWHEVIREYFSMKKKNPTLTRADFVRMKNDPRIKAKTFNSKVHYMSKYGALPHKKQS